MPRAALRVADRGRGSLLALTLCALIVVGVVPLLLDLAHLDNTYYAPKSRALYVLTPVILLAFAVHARAIPVIDEPALIATGSFIVIAAAATLLSVNPVWSLRGSPWRNEGFGAYLGYVAVFLASWSLARSGRAPAWQIAAVSGGTIAAAYGIAQYLGYEWLIRDGQRMGWFVAFSASGNPNYLGAYMVLILPLAAALVLIARKTLATVLALGASGGIFLAALCTYSRAAWVALGLELVLIGIFLWRWWSGVERGRVVLLGAMLAVVLVVFVLPDGPLAPRAEGLTPALRARSILAAKSSWMQQRRYLWGRSLELLRSRPVLGYGPEMLALVFPQHDPEKERLFGDFPSVTVDKAHNDTLDFAISIGLLGVLAYWSVIVLALRRALHAVRRRGPDGLAAIALLAGLVAYWCDLQFHFSVPSVAPVFWSAMGVASGLPASMGGRHAD